MSESPEEKTLLEETHNFAEQLNYLIEGVFQEKQPVFRAEKSPRVV